MERTKYMCFVCMVALCLMPCATRLDAAITPMDYPDADTVILGDSSRIEYAADGTFVGENDERILALTDKGRRGLRTFSLSVSRRYGDAEIVKVEIIGTNGVARPVDFRKTLREATDNSSNAANIYDPLDRKITCAVPGIEVGEIRHVVTRTRCHKTRMRDAFASGALFESTSPIVQSSFEVVAPKERPIVRVKLRHAVGDTVVRMPDKTLPDGRILMKWTAANVPQAFPEPDMPAFSSVAQKLLVSTIKTWEDVSRWYWDLCRPRIEATNENMTNKVASLVGNAHTDMEKVRAVFKFVSQEIRYMGLTLEDESPGYAPHDVCITFDNRYGVCRDKAVLLVAMLRIAGIESYPVLIYVGPKMDEDVPLPYFNHAVAAVRNPDGADGEEFLLMDPTNENTKDLLPAYLMDRSYIVAHPDGRPLAVVPVKPASDNAFRAETHGSLEPDGSALVSTVASFGGVNDLYRGNFAKKTPKERRQMFERMLRAAYPGAELLAFEMTPSDMRDTEKPLGVSLTARLPDLVVRGKTRDELVPPFVFAGFGMADRMLATGTELDKRRYPLTFPSTALSEEKLSLRVGESLGSALDLPPDVMVGDGGCRYERCLSVKDGVLSGLRRRSVDTTEILPEKYDELKGELKAIELGVRRKPQFAVRDAAQEANIRMCYDRCDIHLASPFSWTATNTWEKEVLTYAGKKSSAEIVYTLNPAVGYREIVSATVSNKNGRVYPVTAKEMHVLDAGWVASAPRYPASKKFVVNLPAVETGSVIRVTTVTTITNSPIAYCNLFALDSTEPVGLREVSISGCDLKVMETGFNGKHDDGDVFVTRSYFVAVTNPVALPREGSQPPAFMWRRCALVSAANMDEYRESLFSSLASARKSGSKVAGEKALALTDGIASPEEKIKAVRNWLWKNIRIAGPGLFVLPFDQAFFPPDRSIADGYASGVDWMNVYFAMLEAIGFDAEFVLTDDDAAGYAELRSARIAVPQPDDFGNLLIRATIREGGWFFGLFGGMDREFILDYENDCTPIGVRDVDGRNGRTESFVHIDLNSSGAARISISNSTWGVGVGALRKRYSEMLPEMRARHHTELIGNIAESAEAVSGLDTDVDGYPFTISYSAYAPNYAAKNGDTLTLVVPWIGGAFMPGGETDRKSPFGVGGRLCPSVKFREVVFPEGYTTVEYVPDSWRVLLPGGGGVEHRLDVKSWVHENRLHVAFREEHLPGNARMFTKDWLGFFRDWNRRTASRLSRTVVVRKAK